MMFLLGLPRNLRHLVGVWQDAFNPCRILILR